MSILPSNFDIKNPEHVNILRNYLSDKRKGYYAIKTTSNIGSYIYNSMIDKFIQIPNSTFIKKANDPVMYVTVDNTFHKVQVDVPLTISVVIKLHKLVSPTEELVSKVKQVVVDFINSKKPEENIYFSELVSLLKLIPSVENARIVEPKHDIVFNYSVDDIELEDFISYQPELIYTVPEKITVVFE